MNLSHAQPAVGDGNVMQKEVLLVRLLHGAWRSRVFFLQALRGFAPWNPTGFAVNHNISKRCLCTPQPCHMSPPIAPPHQVLPAPALPPHRRPRWDGRRVLRGDVGVCHLLSPTESPASTSYCTVPVTSSIVFFGTGRREIRHTHSTLQ